MLSRRLTQINKSSIRIQNHSGIVAPILKQDIVAGHMDEAYLLPRSASIEDPLRWRSNFWRRLRACRPAKISGVRSQNTSDGFGPSRFRRCWRPRARTLTWNRNPRNLIADSRRQGAKTTSSRGVSTHGPSQCRGGIGSSIRVHENPHTSLSNDGKVDW